MGDVDHGDAEALVEVLDLVLHLLAQLLVERAERLVHHDQLGLEHERARDRDPLLLAARELGGAALPEARELDHVERLPDPRLDLGRRGFAHLERERQVLVDRHVREQGVVLEHHADVAPVAPGRG